MADLPQILSPWTSPSYKRADVTAAGGPKILSNLTPFYTFTSYVAINHPLLTPMPQELCKLTNILAVRAREVNCFQTCTEVHGPP